jgi:hypothetical protein
MCFVFTFAILSASSISISVAVGEVESGELNGPCNLHGVCAGKGSGCGDRGDAMTEGSNEKGRSDASISLVTVEFRLGHGGVGCMGRTEETECPQARKM